MSRLRAAIIAALAGFAILAVELAAVRLFAPHFGDSAYVWTNVIGVLLIALAGGAWLGSRLAVGGLEERRLGQVLVVAGVLTALVPLVAGWLGRSLVPADLALEDAQRTLVMGSLGATLLAFAPPVTLAGAVTPLLVGALARQRGHPAQASGLVAAWGTLGSLCGTFLTTHLLVPELGSRATIWVAAFALAIAGLLASRRKVLAVGAAMCIAPALIPLGALDPPAAGVELRAELESAYQFLQVKELPATDVDPAATVLRINEGLDSFHSVRLAGTPWTGGRYYDWFAPLPHLLDRAVTPVARVLSLGGAAGTFERLFKAVYPRVSMHSVEIDPAVTALGRAWFGAFTAAGSVTAGLDARVFVNRTKASWDLVLVDAYERQVYVPAHVASIEFFGHVHAILADGGIVAVNVGGVHRDDPVVVAIAGTVAAAFGEAFAFRVPHSRNFVVAARKSGGFRPETLASVTTDDATLAQLCATMSDGERWYRFAPAAQPLVDDRPLLDALHDRAAIGAVGGAAPIACAGNIEPEQAAQTGFDRANHGDLEGVLEAVASSSTETAYLRLLAGDATWALHEPRAARVEYQRGLQLNPDDATRQLLEARTVGLAPFLSGKDLAEDSARRAGFVALGAALGLAVLFAFGLRLAARAALGSLDRQDPGRLL